MCIFYQSHKIGKWRRTFLSDFEKYKKAQEKYYSKLESEFLDKNMPKKTFKKVWLTHKQPVHYQITKTRHWLQTEGRALKKSLIKAYNAPSLIKYRTVNKICLKSGRFFLFISKPKSFTFLLLETNCVYCELELLLQITPLDKKNGGFDDTELQVLDDSSAKSTKNVETNTEMPKSKNVKLQVGQNLKLTILKGGDRKKSHQVCLVI